MSETGELKLFERSPKDLLNLAGDFRENAAKLEQLVALSDGVGDIEPVLRALQKNLREADSYIDELTRFQMIGGPLNATWQLIRSSHHMAAPSIWKDYRYVAESKYYLHETIDATKLLSLLP